MAKKSDHICGNCDWFFEDNPPRGRCVNPEAPATWVDRNDYCGAKWWKRLAKPNPPKKIRGGETVEVVAELPENANMVAIRGFECKWDKRLASPVSWGEDNLVFRLDNVPNLRVYLTGARFVRAGGACMEFGWSQEFRPHDEDEEMTLIASKKLEKLLALADAVKTVMDMIACVPDGIRADWRDTNHYELQSHDGDEYWWLTLEGFDCKTEDGKRAGLLLDLAVAATKLRVALAAVKEE